MKSSDSPNSLNVELDILGQQPLLRIYTQVSLIYSHPSSIPDDASILSTLTQGLERLAIHFPWTAGQVVHEDVTEDNTGVFKIKALDPIPRLIVKDLRNDEDPSVPSMDQLREAKFPMQMLDEDLIAPRRTLPGGPGYSLSTDPEPVLLLQVTFIRGGLILTVNGQHACMDMVGQESVIRLLDKACRNEDFTPEELACGNLDRSTVLPVPLMEQEHDGVWQLDQHELEDQLVDLQNPPPSHDMDASQVLFSFSPSSLAALKSEATQTLDMEITNFISTDDALTAFLWKSICRVRLHRLDPDTPTTFARAINVRKACGVSPTYPGLLQNMTYHKASVQEIVREPLGSTASRLRSQLNPADLKRRTQALITALARAPNKSIFSLAAKNNPGSDIQLSSWAKMSHLWHLDLGLVPLRKPESVRRPHFTPLEGLLYLMPKSPTGEICAAIALRNVDLEALRREQEFVKYAKHLG